MCLLLRFARLRNERWSSKEREFLLTLCVVIGPVFFPLFLQFSLQRFPCFLVLTYAKMVSHPADLSVNFSVSQSTTNALFISKKDKPINPFVFLQKKYFKKSKEKRLTTNSWIWWFITIGKKSKQYGESWWLASIRRRNQLPLNNWMCWGKNPTLSDQLQDLFKNCFCIHNAFSIQ